MEPLNSEQEVTLAESGFVYSDIPVTDSLNWAVMFGDIPVLDPG